MNLGRAEIKAIQNNLEKLDYKASRGLPVNVIYFGQYADEIPAVSCVGDPDILMPALASIIHALSLNMISPAASKQAKMDAESATIKTIQWVLREVYWRNNK